MNSCAICGSHEFRRLLTIDVPDRFELSIGVQAQGYERDWLECNRCGAASNHLPDISAQRLNALRSAYYEVDFMGSDIGEKYRRVMSLPANQSDNAGRVERIMKFCGRWFSDQLKPRVMDIGAGTGVFLSRLSDQTDGAWDCVGVEPDPRAAEHLRKLDQFKVVEAMYLGQPELTGFNLVTLNKVLEHIEQPLPFLKNVVQSLATDESLLYIEVPDKLTIQFRPPQDNILGALHCHLYDPLSLSTLIKNAGLEILTLGRVAEPSGKLTVYAFASLASSVHLKEFPHE